MKINLLDKLFVGFYAYNKNFYSENFSSEHAIILLSICLSVISVPIILAIDGLFIQRFIANDGTTVFRVFSAIIIVSIYFTICFVYGGNRAKKVAELYKIKGEVVIKKRKRISGLFAVLSFVWLVVGIILGAFLYKL